MDTKARNLTPEPTRTKRTRKVTANIRERLLATVLRRSWLCVSSRRGRPLLRVFEDFSLPLGVFVEALLPLGAMRRRRDLHRRDFVLGAIGCPVTVFCCYDVRTGFRVVEGCVDHTRLYTVSYRRDQ